MATARAAPRAPAPTPCAQGDGAGPCPAGHDDDGHDAAVARLGDAGSPDREGRTDGRRAARGPRSGADRRPAQERAVHIVGDPPGYLLELACAGEDLDDAAREVLDERARVGQVGGRGRLVVEELFVRDARVRAATARRCARDQLVCRLLDGVLLRLHGDLLGGGHGLLLLP